MVSAYNLYWLSVQFSAICIMGVIEIVNSMFGLCIKIGVCAAILKGQ